MTAARVAPLPGEALEPIGAVAHIGLVLLSTDRTTEADFARLVTGLPPRSDVQVHTNRITFDNPLTPESLAMTAPRLTEACMQLLPGTSFRAVYYSCTSASAVIDDDGVAAAVKAAKPEAEVVNPLTASRLALGTLGARRLSLLAPYTAEVTERTAEVFEAAGFALDRVTCWGLTDDRDMARVKPDSIAEAALKAFDPSSDALFIACTALRSAEVAAEIEAVIDRPVVTSNLAAAWVCRALSGLDQASPMYGRLFERNLR